MQTPALRRKRLFSASTAKQRGAALLLLVSVLALGAATLLMTGFSPQAMEQRRVERTQLALAQSRDALMGFAGLSAAATPTMNWMIKSSEPLEQITFGLTINAAAPTDEFYFAYQFGFTDGGDIGYTGIQPTKNSADGNRQFMVLFSSFRKDTSPDHENCKGGADGAQAGATCRLYIPGELGDTFQFKVTKSGQTVTGTVLNETSGREDTIGQWTVGASAGTLAESQIAWIENYKMNNQNYKLSCDNKGWPYYQLKFLPPVGNNGDVAGTISSISRGSDTCPGAIKSTHDASGTLVEGGFK